MLSDFFFIRRRLASVALPLLTITTLTLSNKVMVKLHVNSWRSQDFM